MSAKQFPPSISPLDISLIPHPLDVSAPPSPTTDPDLSSPRSSRPLHKTVHNVRSSSRTQSPTRILSGRTSPTRPSFSYSASLRGDSSPPRPSYSSGNRGTYYGSYNRSPSGTPAGSPHDTPQETPFGSPMISPTASHENLRNIFSNAVVFGDNSFSSPSPQSPLSNQPISHHTRALDNQFDVVEDRPGFFSMTVFETTGKRDETKPSRRRKSSDGAAAEARRRRSSSERTGRRKSGEDSGTRRKRSGGDLDPRRRSAGEDVGPKRRGTAENVVPKRQRGSVESFDPRRRSGGGDISPKRRSTAGESIGVGGRQRSIGIDESQIEAANKAVSKNKNAVSQTKEEKDLTDLDRGISSNENINQEISVSPDISDSTIDDKTVEDQFASSKKHSSETRARVTSTTSRHSDMSASERRGASTLQQLFVRTDEVDESTSPDDDGSKQTATKACKHVTMAPTPRVSVSQRPPQQNYAPSNETKIQAFIQSTKNFFKSKLPKRVRRRIHKSVLSYVIASLFCFIPVMKPIAGPSPFLIITGGIVFLHPARTVGAQIEITFMSLLAVLLSSLWCSVAIYVNTVFNQIYLTEGDKAGRAILMTFLFVGVFTVTLIRTRFPRFFFFGIISCIVMIFSIQRGVDATMFTFNMVSDYSLPIVLGAVIPLFVNFILWPESASQSLARALDDSLRNLSETLDLTTNAFVQDPKNAEVTPNDVIEIEGASDRMRTSIAKMITAYQESRLEISYAYVPPLDFKDVKKSVVNLSQQLASLGLSLTNERFLLEEARKFSIDSGDTAVGEHDMHNKTIELAAKKVEMLQKERSRGKKGRGSKKGTAESSEYTTVESVKSFLSLQFGHNNSDDEDEEKQRTDKSEDGRAKDKEEAANEEENQITTRSMASMFSLSLQRLWTSGSGTPSASNPVTPIDLSPKVPKEIGFGDRDLLIAYLIYVRDPLLDLSECCEATLRTIAQGLEEELDIESEDRNQRKKDKARSWFKRDSEDMEKGKGRPHSIHVDHAGMLQEAIETFDRLEEVQLQTLREEHELDPQFDLGHREELFLVFFFMFSLREVATELQKLALAVKVLRENNGLESDGGSDNFGRRKRFFFPKIGFMKWITSDADHTVARDRGHQSLAYLTKTTQEEPAAIAVEWDLEPEIHRTTSNTSRRKSIVFISPSDGLLSRRKSTPYVNSADPFSRRKSAPFINTVDPFSRRKSAPYINTTDPFARRRSAPYVNQLGSLTRRRSGPFVKHDGSLSRRKSTPFVSPEDLPSRRKSTPFVKPEDLPSRRKSSPSVIVEEPMQLESDTQSEISAVQRSEISARDEEESSIYSINSFDVMQRIPFKLRLRYQLWRWMHSLKSPEFKFAVKVALAIAALESPSFFDTTKAEYANIRGVWSCICILLVLTPTAGGTLREGLLRLGGTVLGALWGYIALSIAVNTYVVFAMELIISYPFWYIFLATPYTKVGTVCLLTYIVVVFNAYGTNTEPVFELAWKRTAMNMVGVVVALIFNWSVWPFVARHELRKNVAIQIQSLGELYSSILGTYFYFDPKVPPSQADNDSFAHRERVLQSQIQVCKELLKLTNHEPRLKGPFPVMVYDGIMKSMQNLLDRLISLRTAACQISPDIQKELRQQIHVYRRDLVAAVMLYFHVVSTSLKSKSPLPTYLPSARIARIRLINQLRASMHMMPLTGGAGLEYRNMYWYAYMSLVEEIIEELENIGSLVRLITRESVGLPNEFLARGYLPVGADDDDYDDEPAESESSALHNDEEEDGIRGYYEDELVRKQSVSGAPLFRKFSVSSAIHPTARKYSVSSLYSAARKQSIAGPSMDPSSLSVVDDKDDD